MKVGIVGFAGSGKTTVFNTLTGLSAEVGSYGGSARVNLGIIKVPDERVDRLAEIYHRKRKIYAEINFVDFAGPQGGVSKNTASNLDPKTVPQMREVDALVHVVRGFDNPMLNAAPDPVRDINNFEAELILSDLVPIENRQNRLKKEKGNEREKEVLEKCRAQLEAERPLRDLDLSSEEWKLVSGFRFLSQKPKLLLLNLSEADISKGAPQEIIRLAESKSLKLITMCGKAEMEIAELEPHEEAEFLKDLGISEPARNRFIRAVYELLDLISFLTVNENECRAWTIKRGTNAQKAAGEVHSDIERGFIRAEVVAFEDLIQYGSEAKCREAGKLRLEGKDYIVRDGDVIYFRFNV